jgi:hypothetical protein
MIIGPLSFKGLAAAAAVESICYVTVVTKGAG